MGNSSASTDTMRLRLVLSTLRVGLWEVDLENERVHCSQQVDQLFGVAAGAFPRTYEAFLAAVHPDDREQVRATIASIVDGVASEYAAEHRVVWPDGTVRWLENRAHATRDAAGRLARLSGTVVDVTTRKQAEHALRENEEILRQLAENLREIVWLRDFDTGRLLYVNAAIETVFQLPRPIEGGMAAWMSRVHPDDRDRIARALRDQEDAPQDMTYRFVRDDGTTRWIHSRSFPFRDATGRTYRAAGIAEDITDRRRTEEQRQHAQKMEAFGQLAGGVAHDFNNLLAVILPHAELAARTPGVPARARESLAVIGEAAYRAATLTRQLLQLARRDMIQPGDAELNEIVVGAVNMLRRVLREDVPLRLELSPTALPVTVDTTMIDLVLMNLVLNAHDAMPTGGALTITTRAVALADAEAREIEGATAGDHACVEVTDTGHGIAPEHLPRLFEPFFTTKPPGKGTGLGLATVRGIVQQHRGSITVRSEPGRGTTVRVLIPSATAPGVAPTPRVAHAPLGGSETVLVVEDDRAVRAALVQVLEHHGYRVLAAVDGAEALRVFDERAGAVQLVITDLVMPGPVSGRALLSELRARLPANRLLVISGYAPEVVGHDLELRDGETVLSKPVGVDRLLSVVRSCLDGATGRADPG